MLLVNYCFYYLMNIIPMTVQLLNLLKYSLFKQQVLVLFPNLKKKYKSLIFSVISFVVKNHN